MHDGSMAAVKDEEGRMGTPFALRTGLKQGSVLSPMLFNIFLGAIINATRMEYNRTMADNSQLGTGMGVEIEYSPTGGVEILKPTGPFITKQAADT
jgi:hypothetical protein